MKWFMRLSNKEKSLLSTGSSLASSRATLATGWAISAFAPSSASTTSSFASSASGSALLVVLSSPSGSPLAALKPAYLFSSSSSSPARSSSSTRVSFFSFDSYKINLAFYFYLHLCGSKWLKLIYFLAGNCPQSLTHFSCLHLTRRALPLRFLLPNRLQSKLVRWSCWMSEYQQQQKDICVPRHGHFRRKDVEWRTQ